MKVIVNGEGRELEPGATIGDVVRALPGLSERGTVVALNGEVVRRAAWDEVRPREGDRIEVLTAVQGG